MCTLYIYFMVMTRNKIDFDKNERKPLFLQRFFSSGMSYKEIIKIITYNDISKFNHKWISVVDVGKLPESVMNRFKNGTAVEMGLFSIFRDYKPDIELNDYQQYLYDNLSQLRFYRPYYEMHILFQNK